MTIRNPRRTASTETRRDRERLLDEALEGTFPASDPVTIGRSDHAGAPPDHEPARDMVAKAPSKRPRRKAAR
jgi:hypothetical protein